MSRSQGEHMVKPHAAPAGPVFFDPTGRRRRGLRAAVAVAAGGACTLAAGLAIGLTAPAQAPPDSIAAQPPGSAAHAGPSGAGAPDPAAAQPNAAAPSRLQSTKRLTARRPASPGAARRRAHR
jgi:hypothetical protein